MGFEVCYICHPKKEEGIGYDTDKKEEIVRKVGKPFDDSTLQDLANAIVAMMARRDIYVLDVKIHELVKHEISFKEAKDGRAIVLKGKRFSLDGTAVPEPVEVSPPIQLQQLPPGVQPHEVMPKINGNGQRLQPHELVPRVPTTAQSGDIDNLYNQPSTSLAVNRNFDMSKVNRKKVMYHVYFEPYMYRAQTKNLAFSEDTRYPVHAVVPSATGKLDQQKIVLTDDNGNLAMLDEKFFTSAGGGLVGDNELNFSGSGSRRARKPKLMYDNELVTGEPTSHGVPSHLQGIPLDDGSVPAEYLDVPDLRPGRSVM